MTLCHALDDCEPIEMDCSACRGEGRRGDAYCMACSGTGCEFFSRSELYMLAHNLATAAALCRAFELGRDLQHALSCADDAEFRAVREKQRAEVYRDYFHPGCQRSA